MDTVDQSLPKENVLEVACLCTTSKSSLEKLGTHVSRYGLVITLLSIGVLKFTAGNQELVVEERSAKCRVEEVIRQGVFLGEQSFGHIGRVKEVDYPGTGSNEDGVRLRCRLEADS